MIKKIKKRFLIKLLFFSPNYPTFFYISRLFEPLRQYCIKELFKSSGRDGRIRSRVLISGFENISIGEKFVIGPNSIINATDTIEIGDYFLGGPQVIIYTAEHGMSRGEGSKPFVLQKNCSSPVVIGSNVYVGARVVILPGVRIGNNVVIAAGSVVTKNIPDNETWGGVPAKKIGV